MMVIKKCNILKASATVTAQIDTIYIHIFPTLQQTVDIYYLVQFADDHGKGLAAHRASQIN